MYVWWCWNYLQSWNYRSSPMCQVGLCQQAEMIIREECGEDGLNKGKSSSHTAIQAAWRRHFQRNQSSSPGVSAALNQLPWAPGNKQPGGLGELLDKQLHVAVAPWLSVFQLRSLNVDQFCSHATESATSLSCRGPVSQKGHSLGTCPAWNERLALKSLYSSSLSLAPAQPLTFSLQIYFLSLPHLVLPFAARYFCNCLLAPSLDKECQRKLVSTLYYFAYI